MTTRHIAAVAGVPSVLITALTLSLALALTGCGAKEETDDVRSERESAVEGDAPEAAGEEGIKLAKKVDPAPAVPPAPVEIIGISGEGDGCPLDTIATNISPDGAAFTTIFAEFQIFVEGGRKARRVSRSCRIDLDLLLPVGWQVAVISIDQRGYAEIPDGGKARLETKLSFAETRRSRKVRNTIHGPYADDFQFSRDVKLRNLRWSPCGGAATLEIDVKATVKARRGQDALLALDSVDGELEQDLGLTYRKCK
jgi:hypothetical protein